MVGSCAGDLNGPSPSMSIVPAKKFRKGTPKSRNGCITCKIRRIKCDEGRPACLKCTNTGRKCDGYATKNPQRKIQRSRAPQFSFNNPFLDFSGTKREHRFLTFFYHHTAPVISGCFDFDFWNELIPQVGQHEPAIQHAMIAVAVVHARLELVDELLDSVDKLEESRRFELGQYNKAIHHLREHISANGAIGEVTLMSCVLLICLEFLRGSIEQAILHLQGGITILNIYHNNAKLKTAKNSSRVYSSSDAIARKLEAIFYRLRIQWTLCGRSATSLDEIEISSDLLELNEPFSSLQEARTSLDYLNCLLLRFINFSIKCLYSPSSAKDDHNNKITLSVMQGWLCAQYENWLKAFESFVTQREPTADSKFINGSTLLRIFYLTGTIWLSACVSLKEKTFDDKIEEFSSVIALASSLIGDFNSRTGSLAGSSTKRSFSFTFEIGVIAPLYFTVITCRNGKIRRKALALLSSSMPRREGPWDAGILQYAAKRVVEIEEAGLDDFIASSADPVMARETFMPADQDRVVDVTIRHEHDIFNQGRKSSSITYMMKPIDGSKEWIFRQEDVVQDVDLMYRKVSESTFTKSLESATDLATAAFEV